MTPARLSPVDADRIYVDRIRPDLFEGVASSETPVAMMVAGQPGAGVASAASILRQGLTKTTGAVVALSEARLRPYHPFWRVNATNRPEGLRAGQAQAVVAHWFDRVVQDARKAQFHLLIEDELRDARAMHKLAVALHKNHYVVQAVLVHTPREESALAVAAQYDLLRRRGLPAPFISTQAHEAAWGNVMLATGVLEDRRAVDGIRVIDRQGGQFYDNRLTDGEWLRTPRAQATLDVARDKPHPPKDLVKFAMRWETLVQQLVHDADVPRDVASDVLLRRNDAMARCEAEPAAAQMLRWAQEGAAFRRMDRFEFEREYPHHARAVKSLGAAFIEAENYDAAERARFTASARENIAQRIERGDMARIAARERSQEPPTR